MKAILMSIKPQHVANILNEIKTLEIRKRFPSDYVGWVYIYCTKNGEKPYDGLVWDSEGKGLVNSKLFPYAKNCPEHDRLINGKVVARFWCDKVEKINAYSILDTLYETTNIKEKELLKVSCLTYQELNAYLKHKTGYAIHITKLEIFDKPKEIKEFSIKVFPHRKDNLMTRYLTRAPESWCYVEI